MNALKQAYQIINTHNYSICKQCSKKNCKTYCLPVEMFIQILEQDEDTKLEYLDNISDLFTDEGETNE
jgi:hypothetical protein